MLRELINAMSPFVQEIQGLSPRAAAWSAFLPAPSICCWVLNAIAKDLGGLAGRRPVLPEQARIQPPACAGMTR